MYDTILETFRGREDVLAMQPAGENFRPIERGPLSVDEYVREHVGGETCYGFYLMRPDNTVTCTCVDFDDHADNPDPDWQDKADRFYQLLLQLGLTPLMEVSASGSGAHLWLVFNKPIEAWKVRQFWQTAGQRINYDPKEIYPRQDQLRGKGLGNLIRLPYWNRSRFVDPFREWEEVQPEDIPRTDVDEFIDICLSIGTRLSDPPTEASSVSERVERLLKVPNSLLARRWRGDTDGLSGDTSRSVVAFAICCELVYQHVPTEEIHEALNRWCDLNDYNKPDSWKQHTIEKAYQSVHTRATKEKKHLARTIATCAEFFLSRLGNTHHFATGIVPLDYAMDGIAPGEVGIIAARPGHCKSALALQWIDYQARLGVPCLMLNAEMSAYEIGRRQVMSLVGGEESEWVDKRDEIIAAIHEYYAKCNPPLFEPVGTIDEVEDKIRHYSQQHAVKLVAVDYLQLLRSSTASGRYETVTEISQRIKGAARDNDVAIIALCQVSREVERRDKLEFQASDLRESGQLEQDADLIAFGWWWGRSGNAQKDQASYEMHIVKRRNGPVRKTNVKLNFNPEKQRFGW